MPHAIQINPDPAIPDDNIKHDAIFVIHLCEHLSVSGLTTEHEGAHRERPELPLQIRSHISRDDAAEIPFSWLSYGNLWLVQVNEIDHSGVNWTHS